MDRLTEMQIYVAVAECEGFAAAARRLGISPPVATRAVAELEARLGVKLLNRTTRYVRVTDAGQRYLEDARRVVVAADEADEAAIGVNGEPRGHLTVTAPVLFGRMYVMPGIVDYLQRFPATDVAALFVDRVVNLLEEGVDVALRIGDLDDSSFHALRVGSVRRLLCASPDYIARCGLPAHPNELVNHQLIVAMNLGTSVEWRFMQQGKTLSARTPLAIRIKPRLSVTSNDSAIDAAVRGLGIARVMSYQIAQELEQGKLKILLSEFEPDAVPVHIVHREGRYSSAKVRQFIDLLAERLRANKSLN
ncbi:MAG: LysR family transcriptional regulator [Cellvibrio sp.]|uniref:LysR family transcriptional regulator n=1 Tax=Cellvibrio sp. TaxID=1965322 RepID=UPI0031A1765F